MSKIENTEKNRCESGLSIAVCVSREDDPRDVDEAYGAGTYERLFPGQDEES